MAGRRETPPWNAWKIVIPTGSATRIATSAHTARSAGGAASWALDRRLEAGSAGSRDLMGKPVIPPEDGTLRGGGPRRLRGPPAVPDSREELDRERLVPVGECRAGPRPRGRARRRACGRAGRPGVMLVG